MSGDNPTDGSSTDIADRLVRGMVAAMSDSGERAVPAATTDADEVIRSQLTENTGRHLLDSGSAYGRNWEENRDNPPWERAAWNVNSSWVTHNVYDFMHSTLDRNEVCVALETALYAYAYSDERKRDAWLRCMEDFADGLLAGDFSAPQLRALGVPAEAVESVLGVQAELRRESDHFGRRDGVSEAVTYNTYNSETHTLSQVLQGTNLGGPYSEYVFIQVHGGCDIRGGYTAPRVYTTWDGWIPTELGFYCTRCEWTKAESCLYHTDALLFQPTVDEQELFEAVVDRAPEHASEADVRDAVADAAEQAREDEHSDGAVFHLHDGCAGLVDYA